MPDLEELLGTEARTPSCLVDAFNAAVCRANQRNAGSFADHWEWAIAQAGLIGRTTSSPENFLTRLYTSQELLL